MNSAFFRMLFFCGFLLFLSCERPGPETEIFQQTLFAFDTVITVTVTGNRVSPERFERLIRGLKDRMDQYDLIYNPYNPRSALSRIRNMEPGRLYRINAELYGLLARCRDYHAWTRGAFDITVGRITRLYRFSQNIIPGPLEIRTNLSYTGMDKLILTNGLAGIKKKGLSLDLGGVAKGTIIDGLSAFILKQGMTNFIVNIGGDLYASGKNSRGRPWEIGIQHPRQRGRIIKRLRISRKAVVTSGDYERYVLKGKKRLHHILDPRTGLPVQNGIMSVTVIARRAEIADYTATALFVLGQKEGARFIRERYGKEISFIVY